MKTDYFWPLVFSNFVIFLALHKFAFGLDWTPSALWAIAFTALYIVPLLGGLNWLFQIIIWISCFHVVWWQALLWSGLVGYLQIMLVKSTPSTE
jgi:hypothetical protein